MKNIVHSTLATTLLFVAGFSFAHEPVSIAKENAFRKNEDMITKMVELRLSVSKARFWSRSINARIDLIGHLEFSPFRSGGERFERMALVPEIGDQGGFTVELRNAKGELIPATIKDRRLKLHLAGISPSQGHVYRTIRNGVFETLTFPLSQWFDITSPGIYTVRVQYKVAEASTKWSGPATSNSVSFAVK